MQKPTIVFAVTLALLVLFVALPDTVDGACCRKHSRYTCADCSAGTPCCGHGPCNIFCCNCNCRQGSCARDAGKRSVDSLPGADSINGADVVIYADTNADGNMTLKEASNYLITIGIVPALRSLQVLDVNNDGVLTAEEIDG